MRHSDLAAKPILLTLCGLLTYINFGPSAPHKIKDESFSNADAVIRRDHIRKLCPPLLDPTDDREDVAPAAGWHSGGVEHLYALLPGGAALRLCIRTAGFTLAFEAAVDCASRTALSCIHQLANRSLVVLGEFSSANRQSFVVVIDVSGGVGWSAFLHRLEQQPVASKMVFTNVNRVCARSLLSLLSFECRQLTRAAGVSRADGTVLHFASAGPIMDRGLRAARVAHRT